MNYGISFLPSLNEGILEDIETGHFLKLLRSEQIRGPYDNRNDDVHKKASAPS